MAIVYNGTTVNNIVYNGTQLSKVIYNGTTVWESSRTMRFNFAGVLVGASDGINGTYPNTSGTFRINTNYGAMWCMSTGATDTLGSGTTFGSAVAMNVTDMKMFVYRANTQTFNTSAVQTAWIYNTPPNAAGARALIMDNSTLNNNGYTYVNTATPVPATVGLVQVSLTTAQLVSCFRMPATTISSAAGHVPTQVPAGTYKTLGLRGLYSNNPQFTWLNQNSTYGYIEITAG